MTVYRYTEIKADTSFYELAFEGELRSGKDIESEDFSNLIKKIRKQAESKIVLLDLTNLQYWDSEGMRKLLIPVKEINSNYPDRAILIGSLKSKNFERAKEKYEVGKNQIPWFETKKDYLDTIK